MKYALFTEAAKAFKHRSTWGGWLALTPDGNHHWFDPRMTPTNVILAPQLRGLSAKLL